MSKSPQLGRPEPVVPRRRSAPRSSPRPAPNRSSPRRRGWAGALFKWGALLALWGLIGVGGIVGWYAMDLPDIDAAASPTRRPAVTILAADGSELATLGDYFGQAVTLAEIPPTMPRAVMAIEDRRFYHHFGIDVFGLARALFVNLRAGRVVQGGSTITQQAAKNLFLSPERTIKRKIQELLLAFWLEYRFSKDQIFALYLNRAYFGAGAYGIDAAARRYFDKPASRISVYQAALLAGLLKAPSRYNPLVNPDLAEERTKDVLAAMVDANVLSLDEAKRALRDQDHAVVGQRLGPSARYFVDWVMAQLPQFVSARDRDITVRTTLDPRLQTIAETKLEQMLASAAARKGAVGQAALVALGDDGAVHVMVGGRDYAESSFNRATQAYRQPGSAFKPIVYAAGLEAGLTEDSRFIDAPLQIGSWQPRNFSGRYEGEMSLRHALAESVNTVAVQVGQQAGARRVIDVARRLGITADLDASPSLALGTSEVSLVELTAAYAAFANGGRGVFPYAIERVTDRQGRALYVRTGSGAGRVLAAEDAAAITDMLVAAVETGTGRAARFGRPIAGKTGTSQDFRDAWFIGFSADLIAGVWMGNDDDQPMRGITGGSLPAQLWRAFMADGHAGRPPRSLPSLYYAPPPVREPTQTSRDDEGERRREAAPADARPDFFDRLKRVFGG